MADKDVAGVVGALAASNALRDARIVATQLGTARALPATELARVWRTAGWDAGSGAGRSVTVVPDPLAALESALSGPPGPLIVAGSLYLVGAARARLVDDPLLRDPVDNRP